MTTALDELFASNPTGVKHHITLEISHPAFTPVTHRMVQGYDSLVATLESAAPYNSGEAVTFQPVAFKVSLPEKSTKGRQDMAVTIYGAAVEIVEQLEKQAVANRAAVKVTLREFESGDLSAPASEPITMTALNPQVNNGVVTFSATFADVINKSFPSINYKLETHPGLA